MKNSAALGAYLKQATRSEHQQLDQHPRLSPLMHSALQLSDYQSALTGLYGGQVALEAAVQAGLDTLQLAYPLVLRSPALVRDLGALNVALPETNLDCPLHPRTFQTSTLNIRTLGQLIGALYVLEGAKLGSRVIARNVQRRLGEQVAGQVPSEFFTGSEFSGSESGTIEGQSPLSDSWVQF
ncbi:biliverdin-producing heme oxygenase [Oceanisphaera sp. W20_SRM_FM3]|uniref:biliverdin-producing heme oxygenase n=1 Tax=Oceanisphaera sp. W20_SRM_FM3 TaxID=3240267 RepID=UPI003F9D2AC4